MNEQLQTIISMALGAVVVFAVVYCISLAVSYYQKWLREKEDETPPEIRPIVDEVVKRVTVDGSAPQKVDSGDVDERGVDMSRHNRSTIALDAANRSRLAYGNGCLVEAYYYATIARLCGHLQLSSAMSQMRVNWRLAGYPDEKELVGHDFDDVQSAIGRAMLRIDSNHDRDRGYACLTDLANDDNELAIDLLKSLPPW